MIDIPQNKVIELLKKGFSLEIVYFLERLKDGDIDKEHPKVDNIFKIIVRKGLFSESTGKLTISGEELLSFVLSPDKEKIEKKIIVKTDDFDLWWDTFPLRSKFVYKGRSFSGARILRKDKDGCKTKIKAILNQGDVTLQEIIDALKLEIHEKMENSLKTGQNKMDYMNNSLTWLNQGIFWNYIDDIRAGKGKIQESSTISNETYI